MANTSYNSTDSGVPEQPESLLRPGANRQIFVWLAVFGIPALILFMIYAKMQEPGPVIPVQIQQQQEAIRH